ncbi:hypothetical protein NIES23_29730 [Trichormus variabilis NIES-23]|uniref:Uncharacterized protein n=1 Tax=Trichormus variabilis NIES-23 TaxID=1973479 RepID=A0A1Z4KMK1_ANAVA|nr:hypothetical protein NIES23_29730 [Trichormus variabilis NIES-23]
MKLLVDEEFASQLKEQNPSFLKQELKLKLTSSIYGDKHLYDD